MEMNDVAGLQDAAEVVSRKHRTGTVATAQFKERHKNKCIGQITSKKTLFDYRVHS